MEIINTAIHEKNQKFCQQRKIVLPTLDILADPANKIPEKILSKLQTIRQNEVSPYNLFRIHWQNAPLEFGGKIGDVNLVELPSKLTGVAASIWVLPGKWFPGESFKIGEAYANLVAAIITGSCDLQKMPITWPSNGNYARTGALITAILGGKTLAILPANAHRQQQQWHKSLQNEIFQLTGANNRLSDIYQKIEELKIIYPELRPLDQHTNLAGHWWHYQVTGTALTKLINEKLAPEQRFFGSVFPYLSGALFGAATYLKQHFPSSKLAIAELLENASLLPYSFANTNQKRDPRLSISWYHDMKNTDLLVGLPQNTFHKIVRLFNESKGRSILKLEQVPTEIIEKLDQLGVNGVLNVCSAIKMAKYYELGSKDVIITFAEDSVSLEQRHLLQGANQGMYETTQAYKDLQCLHDLGLDYLEELSYYQKKSLHYQKVDKNQELDDQWYQADTTWSNYYQNIDKLDHLIKQFTPSLD